MIVDCHTHFAGDAETAPDARQNGTAECRIVLGNCSDNCDAAAETLSEFVGTNPNRLFGFAAINPVTDDISPKRIRRLVDKLGLPGAVLYCSACAFHPAHTKAMCFYELAEEMQIPVFFHNAGQLDSYAVLDYAQPYMLDEIARTFPSLKIVIGSMGLPFVNQTLSMISKHENVYADITIAPKRSWLIYNTVIAAYEENLLEKLLFGSGYPKGNAGEYIETLLGFNKMLGDASPPVVPRGQIRKMIERDTLSILGINRK